VKTRFERASQRGAALWRGVAGCRSGCCPSLLGFVSVYGLFGLEKLVVLVFDVGDAVEAAGALGAIENCAGVAGIGVKARESVTGGCDCETFQKGEE
jgi:hypothetical protein